jgi:hypothetical protein
LDGIGKPDDDDYDEVGNIIETISSDAGKRIVSGISKCQSGDVTGGMVEIAIAFTEIHTAFTLKIAYP